MVRSADLAGTFRGDADAPKTALRRMSGTEGTRPLAVFHRR